jgi:hypothetical protein
MHPAFSGYFYYMPVWIIPSIYFLLFIRIISRWRFFNGLVHIRWLQVAFAAKVLAGIANYAIWEFVIGRGDSLNYIHDADLIYSTLFHHPAHFFQLTFGWGPDNVYPDHLLYISEPLKYSWNNVEYTMVRINALLHIITFGNVWGNIVLLNFLYFLGACSLYRAILGSYPAWKTGAFLLLFFLPSITIWSSGVLKEGPALLFTQIIVAQLLLIEKGVAGKHFFVIVACLIGLLFIREYFTLLLLPLLLLWWVGRKWQIPLWKLYGVTGLVFVLLVIAVDSLSYRFTVSEIICEAQQFFLFTGVDPDYIYYTFTGYELNEPLRKLPYALNNILFRPNVLHSSDAFRIFQAIELSVTWVLFMILLLRLSSKSAISGLTWLLTAFSIVLLLMYGYVVTDADTMSRYRSIPLFLLLLAWLLPSQAPKWRINSL